MTNPTQSTLNSIITSKIPEINSGIQGVIRSQHLDPWGQVAHASKQLGSINLGICSAQLSANYNIQNMTGLSSFSVDQLKITSVDSCTPGKLTGIINMTASLGGNLSARVGGNMEAQCGYIHPRIGINGSANVTGVTADAVGYITASINGSNVCLNVITLSGISINYGDVNVSIDGLGIFNEFLEELIELVKELFKGQVQGAISSAMTPIINEEIKGVLPQCQNFL